MQELASGASHRLRLLSLASAQPARQLPASLLLLLLLLRARAQSRFHVSFAEYRSAERSQYGVLRVLNDDLVQPARGFGTHPHSNMEICTYIVEGSLTHADSMGTRETLGRGAVQFMTAGTGVRHSEHNLDAAAPLRFIQVRRRPPLNPPPRGWGPRGD